MKTANTQSQIPRHLLRGRELRQARFAVSERLGSEPMGLNLRRLLCALLALALITNGLPFAGLRAVLAEDNAEGYIIEETGITSQPVDETFDALDGQDMAGLASLGLTVEEDAQPDAADPEPDESADIQPDDDEIAPDESADAQPDDVEILPDESADAQPDAAEPVPDEADIPSDPSAASQPEERRFALGGEAVLLSAILEAVDWPLALDEIKFVGVALPADGADVPLSITPVGADYQIAALADFALVELIVETEAALEIIVLTDGKAPASTPEPTEEPTPEPTEEPTPEPTEEPTPEPTEEPTPEPTEEPTPEPTEEPTPEPTEEPTPEPTEEPTPEPTEEPTPEPTEEPTPIPVAEPTPEPTEEPTIEPTPEPTIDPTEAPTPEPTIEPTEEPTAESTPEPTEAPTPIPVAEPITEPESGENTPPRISCPAQTFEAQAAEVRVSVEAPEGAFPEGTTLRVTPVWDRATLSDIEATVSEDFVEVRKVHAVDITFLSPAGEELEPLLPISVVMTVAELAADQDAVVVHVDDEGDARIVEQSEAPAPDADGLSLNVELPGADPAELAEAAPDADDLSLNVELPGADPAQLAEATPDADGLSLNVELPGADPAQLSETDPAPQERSSEGEALGEEADEAALAPFAANADGDPAPADSAETPLAFEADAFSIYAVVVTQTLDRVVKASDGNDYHISVSYGPEAGLPDGATLAVEELTSETAYSEYASQAADALGISAGSISYGRLFDITILSDGEPVQPAPGASVDVSVTLADATGADVSVVHFAAVPEEVTAATQGATVTFSTEGFSVYGFYTVDFHYEVNGKIYDFSIPGGSFTTLEHVVEALGLASTGENDAESEPDTTQAAKRFVRQVERVTFTNPQLISVSKAESDTTIGAIKDGLGLVCEYSTELTEQDIARINASPVSAGDWALISLQAFSSNEELVVTMKNGDAWMVKVTDANDDIIFKIDNDGTVQDETYINDSQGNRKVDLIISKSGLSAELALTPSATNWNFCYWYDEQNNIISLDSKLEVEDESKTYYALVTTGTKYVYPDVNDLRMGGIYRGSDNVTHKRYVNNKGANKGTFQAFHGSTVAKSANDNLFIFAEKWKLNEEVLTEKNSTLSNPNSSYASLLGKTGLNKLKAYFKPTTANTAKITYKTALLNYDGTTLVDATEGALSYVDNGNTISVASAPTGDSVIIAKSDRIMLDSSLESIDSFNVTAATPATGYSFAGWKLKSIDGENIGTNAVSSVSLADVWEQNGDIELVAVYKKDPPSRKIIIHFGTVELVGNTKTFEGVTGTGGSFTASIPQTIIINEKTGVVTNVDGTTIAGLNANDGFKLEASMSNSDYTFAGWYGRSTDTEKYDDYTNFSSGESDYSYKKEDFNTATLLGKGPCEKQIADDPYANIEIDIFPVFAKDIHITYQSKIDNKITARLSKNTGGNYSEEVADSKNNRYFEKLTETVSFNASLNKYVSKGVSCNRTENYQKGFFGWYDESDNPVSYDINFIPTGNLLVDGAVYISRSTEVSNAVRFVFEINGKGELDTETGKAYGRQVNGVSTIYDTKAILESGYIVDRWTYRLASGTEQEIVNSKVKTLTNQIALDGLEKTSWPNGTNIFTAYTRFAAPTITYESTNTSVGTVTGEAEQLTTPDGSLSGAKAQIVKAGVGSFEGWYVGNTLLSNDPDLVYDEDKIGKLLQYCTDNNTDQVVVKAKFEMPYVHVIAPDSVSGKVYEGNTEPAYADAKKSIDQELAQNFKLQRQIVALPNTTNTDANKNTVFDHWEIVSGAAPEGFDIRNHVISTDYVFSGETTLRPVFKTAENVLRIDYKLRWNDSDNHGFPVRLKIYGDSDDTLTATLFANKATYEEAGSPEYPTVSEYVTYTVDEEGNYTFSPYRGCVAIPGKPDNVNVYTVASWEDEFNNVVNVIIEKIQHYTPAENLLITAIENNKKNGTTENVATFWANGRRNVNAYILPIKPEHGTISGGNGYVITYLLNRTYEKEGLYNIGNDSTYKLDFLKYTATPDSGYTFDCWEYQGNFIYGKTFDAAKGATETYIEGHKWNKGKPVVDSSDNANVISSYFFLAHDDYVNELKAHFKPIEHHETFNFEVSEKFIKDIEDPGKEGDAKLTKDSVNSEGIPLFMLSESRTYYHFIDTSKNSDWGSTAYCDDTFTFYWWEDESGTIVSYDRYFKPTPYSHTDPAASDCNDEHEETYYAVFGPRYVIPIQYVTDNSDTGNTVRLNSKPNTAENKSAQVNETVEYEGHTVGSVTNVDPIGATAAVADSDHWRFVNWTYQPGGGEVTTSKEVWKRASYTPRKKDLIQTWEYEKGEFTSGTDINGTVINYKLVTNTITFTAHFQHLNQLTVSKVVTGNLASQTEAFAVTVKLDDTDAATGNKIANTDVFRITGTTPEGVTSLTGAQLKAGYKFSLKHGEQVTIKDIPDGVKYVVTEEERDYDASYTVDSGTAQTGNSATVDSNGEKDVAIAFTNRRNGMKLKKEFTVPTKYSANKQTLAAGEYTFVLTGKSGDAASTVKTLKLTVANDGTVTAKWDDNKTDHLKVDDSGVVTVLGLPNGEYELTETKQDTITRTVDEKEVCFIWEVTGTGTVTIAESAALTATVTNVYRLPKLTITKTVTGGMGDRTKEFDFTVKVADSSDTYAYTITHADGTQATGNVSGNNGVIKLKHGDTAVIDDLPLGANVTVTEAKLNYTATFQLGTAAAQEENTLEFTLSDNAVLAVTNNLDPVSPTGVSDKTMPYWLMLGGGGFAVLALIWGRRRKRRGGDVV